MLARTIWIACIACLTFFLFLISNPMSAGSDHAEKNDVAKVEKIPGSDLANITLQKKAAERLGIETMQISSGTNTQPSIPPTPQANIQNQQTTAPVANNPTPNSVIPYTTLLYDINGGTWVYISPRPLVFVRHKIIVDHIDGDSVYLKEVLPPGTQIVTRGVDELYGVEKGVAK